VALVAILREDRADLGFEELEVGGGDRGDGIGREGPNQQQTTNTCHSECSEESRMMCAGGRAAGFFAALRMTACV
jgi:hypothetical protein